MLAEVFRTTSGTFVSNHPEGRFGARGAGADALVRDVPWDDYYGPGSPLARLVERGGTVAPPRRRHQHRHRSFTTPNTSPTCLTSAG